MPRLLPLLLLALACRGGEDDSASVEPAPACDPTVPEVCALPWPSATFEVADSDTPSGVRLGFGPDALPANRDGYPLQPELINERDGFSNLTPMIAFFEDLSGEGLVSHTDLGASLESDALTVILNAATGERVAHFAELDMHAPPEQRTLVLHPVVPLERSARYVVALRGLVRNDGSPVPASPAFAALRDGTKDPDAAPLADRYESDVFPVLDAAGVDRSELQLAWDFTTGSAESLHRDILHIRDDALTRVGDGPEVTLTSVEEGDCAAGDRIWKRIEGVVSAPRYTADDAPGSIFVRGPDGLPGYQGEAAADFLLQVPCSVAADPSTPPRILQYGHGLFGNRYEGEAGYLKDLAEDNRWVILSMDWQGWALPDSAVITLMIAQDMSGFRMIPERTQQGYVEKMVGLRAVRTTLVEDPELQVDGQPLLEGASVGYYGNSQGAIMGAAYVAVSPVHERAVLGVVTGPYSLVLPRSSSFTPFFLLLEEKYTDYRDIAVLFGAMQTMWDPAEPAGYIDRLTSDPLPGTLPKQVLMQTALGDSQNTTLGAHVLARAVGATTVSPQTRSIWGVDEQAPGFTGSALVEWEYTDVPPAPVENLPPDPDFNTHNCPRKEPTGQEQLAIFLETGVVEHTCEGRCLSQRAGFCD